MVIPLREYYNQSATLSDTYELLCNPSLSFENDREKVNRIVLNLVIKYLARYLEVLEAGDITRIQREIKTAIQGKFMQVCGIEDISDENTEKYGLDMEKYRNQSDEFAIRCLADIGRTAAIVKEIIFNDRFKPDREKGADFFRSVDFGSGTGILLIASLIAAKRKEVKEIVGLGFECQQEAIDRSNKVIEELLRGRDEYAQVYLVNMNQTERYMMFQHTPIHYWISETINSGIPRIEIKGTTVELNGDIDVVRRALKPTHDPFLAILEMSIKYIPDFEQKVREEQIAMFPDLIKGSYKPDGKNSTLQLRTGYNLPQKLTDVDTEFRHFGFEEEMKLHLSRW